MTLPNTLGRGALAKRKPLKPQLKAVPTPAAEAPDRIRTFFDVQLPKLIAHRGDVFDLMKGSLAVFVEGAGCWTINFGDHASANALQRDATFESDCVTVFSVDGFIAVLDGRTDGQAPVMIGDGRLLSKLGQLMIEPARGLLGARLNK